MGLFAKKKNTESSCCCGDVSGLIIKEGNEANAEEGGCGCEGGCDCGGNCGGSDNPTAEEKGLVIKILGSGCKNCVTLAENVKLALEEMKLTADIVKVTDLGEITGYGVMSTPALVVDEKVVSYGKVLKPKEIIKILEKLEA